MISGDQSRGICDECGCCSCCFECDEAGVGAEAADVTLVDAIARNRSVLECDDGALRVGLCLLMKTWHVSLISQHTFLLARIS